jgi:putative aldouronate transport system substrate-binding protein
MKRIVVSMLLITLTAFAFAGGQQDQAGMPESSASLTAPGELPIVTEPVTLTYMIPRTQRVSDYEDNHLTELLEERSNVTIDLRLVSEQDYKDRMNLMFAAQADLPDMINLQNTDINGQLLWGVQGVLRPLNDLIAEHAVKFQTVLQERPQVENLVTAADGNIYSLPNVSSCPHCDPSNRFWINSVWLEELGLDMPTTTEEFKQVLIAFRDRDPNGNGRADEIPLIGARTGWQMNPTIFLLNSFVNWDLSEKMHIEDGEIVPTFTQEAFRDGLAYMNELVEEGLFDPVTFTQDQNQLRTLIAADPPVIGVFPAGGAFFENNPDTSGIWVHLDPLEGPDGVRLAAYNPWTGIGMGSGSITTASENADVAMRWFDQFFDYELSLKARFGVEGRDWRWVETGETAVNSAREPAPAIMLENVWATDQPHSIHWYLQHPYYIHTSIETADFEAMDSIAIMGESSIALTEYLAPVDTQVPPLALLPDEIEEYQELWSTLDTFVNESLVRFIVGDLDVNSDWESYVRQVEGAGLSRFVEMKQAAYDRVWR